MVLLVEGRRRCRPWPRPRAVEVSARAGTRGTGQWGRRASQDQALGAAPPASSPTSDPHPRQQRVSGGIFGP